MKAIAITEAAARKMTAALDERLADFAKSRIALAAAILQCKKQRVPAAMGMSYTEWAEGRAKAAGSSARSMWDHLRFVEELPMAPIDVLARIPEGNLKMLTAATMPVTARKGLLKEAQELQPAAFRAVAAEYDSVLASTNGDGWRIPALPKSLCDMAKDLERRYIAYLQIDPEAKSSRIEAWEAILAEAASGLPSDEAK